MLGVGYKWGCTKLVSKGLHQILLYNPIGCTFQEAIQEPLPMNQKNPSARTAVLLKPSPGQKTLERQGEERSSKSMFALLLKRPFFTKILGFKGRGS